MDFLDWKFASFILGCLNLVGVIIIGLFNYFAHQKLIGNDLKHISLDLKEIKDEQKAMKDKIGELSESVGYLKGKIEI